MDKLPSHLQKYIVDQNAKKYTALDHSVWRYILRQLKNFLSTHGHESYLDGLEKTGISIDSIPSIEDISRKIEKFGWRALPVSGFIPPAAFMEMQSLSVLPIASDMRSVDHLEYTPAPDIVHEAAGHAPLLSNTEYANYLKQYAAVAKKALISKEDLDLYKAIRELSDLKENPNSTDEQIAKAEKNLESVSKNISHVSEASLLGRMNWWTAEYGLIGNPTSPKIFGAGLLSSVGESRWCLSDKVKKIPLSIDCVKYSYDITEPQPQLFVTPDFKTLVRVLEEFSMQMSFKKGGAESLNKAIQAETVNTVQLNTGLQISGVLSEHISSDSQKIHFIKFTGPTQLSFEDHELQGHDKKYHAHGYSTPLGYLKNYPTTCPSQLTDQQWQGLGLQLGQLLKLEFTSGFTVEGIYLGRLAQKGRTLLLSLKQATAKWNDKVYFEPSWGNFDIALGSSIPSVFGGPADRIAYGEVEDFNVQKIPEPVWTSEQKALHKLYEDVRFLRENNTEQKVLEDSLQNILSQLETVSAEDWLLRLEIYELALTRQLNAQLTQKALSQIQSLMQKHPSLQQQINDGLNLANKIL